MSTRMTSRTPLQAGGSRLQGVWILIFTLSLQPGAWSTSAFGASKNAGTSGAAFLKIGPSPRAVAMGEAFTGVADDIQSLYWNPAGLTTLRVPELQAMHMQYFQDIQYESASFAYPTSAGGTWAVGLTNLHTDSLNRRTEDTDAAIGQFKASDSAYHFGYANRVNSSLSFGSTLKYIRQSLDSAKASAWAVDGGALYETPWREMKVGVTAQNIGTKVKFNSEADPLPMTFRAGASMPLLERKLLIASDLIIPRDHTPGLALGGEYRKRVSREVSLAARSGYRTDSDADGLSGVSAGGGLTFGRATFDFAWVPFGDLGNAYRFGLHLKLGPVEEPTPLLKSIPKSAHAKSPAPLPDTSLESLLSVQ